MRLGMDAATLATYMRLAEGEVAETIELDEGIYLDLDSTGKVLGLEFLTPEELTEFLLNNPDGLEIPERVEDPEEFYRRRPA